MTWSDENMFWEARAEYADGTTIEKLFPYRERGIYSLECERQYELEWWLLSRHDDCTWYSVTVINEE